MERYKNDVMKVYENNAYSTIDEASCFKEDVVKIISKKMKSIHCEVKNSCRMGITVSKKSVSSVDFNLGSNCCECVIYVDDKQHIICCHKMLGKKSNILVGSPITYMPDVPIYTPLYNSANDPYNDIFKGHMNVSVNNNEVIINTKNKFLPIEKRSRGRKKSQLMYYEDNNNDDNYSNLYHNNNHSNNININNNISSSSTTYINTTFSNNNNNNNNKSKTICHSIKFSDGTTQNVISKSGSIPKDIDKAYREYNELKFLTVECNKCHNIVYKNDTFNDIMNNVICARCASSFDFNDLYDWSDKDKDEKGWIMCKRCHKKRGKPLNQFLKIDQRGLITIQNTCRNCLLKKCVQYIKDRPFCNSSITNKISPTISTLNNNNNNQSVLLVSQERQSILEIENRLSIGVLGMNNAIRNITSSNIPISDTNTTNTMDNSIATTNPITQSDKGESGLLNSKPFPMFNEISSSSSLSSLERKDNLSTVTLQKINDRIEEVVIPTPGDNKSIEQQQQQQPPPPPTPPPSHPFHHYNQQQQPLPSLLSSQTFPITYNPAFDEPLRTKVIDREKIQSNKSAKELKEQKGNKNIGFDPYEYEFKDKKRYVISKVGVLPQKLDEALSIYQYNFGVKIQCFYCRDVRLRNDCFIDKDGNYICFDCSLKDIKKSGELYDWADRESDPKAAHILCKRCHKKCGKTLDQYLKLDQKDNVIILNTCRNCLLKKNYDYKKNSEFSKPSHHSIYRTPVLNADIISMAFLNSLNSTNSVKSVNNVNSEFGLNGDTFKICERKNDINITSTIATNNDNNKPDSDADNSNKESIQPQEQTQEQPQEQQQEQQVQQQQNDNIEIEETKTEDNLNSMEIENDEENVSNKQQQNGAAMEEEDNTKNEENQEIELGDKKEKSS